MLIYHKLFPTSTKNAKNFNLDVDIGKEKWYINVAKGNNRNIQKGGEMMSEKEKQPIRTMADIFSKPPADQQQYVNGYANGVAEMAEAQAEKNDQDKD